MKPAADKWVLWTAKPELKDFNHYTPKDNIMLLSAGNVESLKDLSTVDAE